MEASRLEKARGGVLPERVARCRFTVIFWLTPLLLLGACTPEATVVDPVGGNGGQEPSGGKQSSAGKSSGAGDSGGTDSGGGGTDAGPDAGGAGEDAGSAGKDAGGGGQGGTPECAKVTSPLGGCMACLQDKCGSELAACADNDCACGKSGDSTGQMSCMLACIATGAKPESCTADCGFAGIPDAHPATRALIDCLMVPPSGPPSCEPCLPPR